MLSSEASHLAFLTHVFTAPRPILRFLFWRWNETFLCYDYGETLKAKHCNLSQETGQSQLLHYGVWEEFFEGLFLSCFIFHWSKIKIGQWTINQQSCCAAACNCFQVEIKNSVYESWSFQEEEKSPLWPWNSVNKGFFPSLLSVSGTVSVPYSGNSFPPTISETTSDLCHF